MIQKLPGIELKPHYVAFLDVLGFTSMVEADSLGDNQEFLSKLFRCHQSAGTVFRDDPSCSVVQFSDSIVISMPYSIERFKWFLERVADYQRLLLNEHLLCRGGIAINKHFSNGSFTFSAGLIDAYKVESKSARYPRVVISPEVLDLVFPNVTSSIPHLITEDDGLLFIDYIGLTKKKKPKILEFAIKSLVTSLSSHVSPSIKEKGLWLAAYSDAVLGTSLGSPRFQRSNPKSHKKIKTSENS